MQRVAETLSAPMSARLMAYAVLVGAVVVILCSLHRGLELAVRVLRAGHATSGSTTGCLWRCSRSSSTCGWGLGEGMPGRVL